MCDNKFSKKAVFVAHVVAHKQEKSKLAFFPAFETSRRYDFQISFNDRLERNIVFCRYCRKSCRTKLHRQIHESIHKAEKALIASPKKKTSVKKLSNHGNKGESSCAKLTEREQTPTTISPRLSVILFPVDRKPVEKNCHAKEKSCRKIRRSEEKGEILTF